MGFYYNIHKLKTHFVLNLPNDESKMIKENFSALKHYMHFSGPNFTNFTNIH